MGSVLVVFAAPSGAGVEPALLIAVAQTQLLVPPLLLVEEPVEMVLGVMEFAQMVLAALNGAGVEPVLHTAVVQIQLQVQLLALPLLQGEEHAEIVPGVMEFVRMAHAVQNGDGVEPLLRIAVAPTLVLLHHQVEELHCTADLAVAHSITMSRA